MSLFLDHLRSDRLYQQLCEQFTSLEGNLLEATDDAIAESQIEFLRWCVHLSSPRVILETGTNKGFFCYLMSRICRHAIIYTFDVDQRCASAVDLINHAQRNVIVVFQAGDTRQTLRDLTVPADFAWIDGGHTADIPFNDLLHCYRLRVPFVAVDDTVYRDVHDAVVRVIHETPYRVVVNPFAVDDRRRAVLLRLDDSQAKVAS